MAFNTAKLVRTSKSSILNASNGCEEITLEIDGLPDNYFTSEPTPDKPLYRFVWRDAFGYHLEPVDQPDGMVGPMADGVYAKIQYEVQMTLARQKGIKGYAVPELMRVHDRFETQEMYDALSR
jgi:hypothetical protein